MENASHAFLIVLSSLIAVVVMFLIIFVFNNLRSLPEAEDESLLRENKTKFNESFLVYDKELMYGVDVLSCLNKAESNNQRYVNNNYYGVDTISVTKEDREENLINVKVKIKNPIQEQITVYYKDSDGKLMVSPTKEYNYKPFADSAKPKFQIPDVDYYYFESENIMKKKTSEYTDIIWVNDNIIYRKLQTQSYSTKMVGGEYSLLNDPGDKKTGQLSALLSTVSNVEQTIYHDSYHGYGDSNWYCATWRTAVYDFKTRKFKCVGDEIEYNENGYVKTLSFEEI